MVVILSIGLSIVLIYSVCQFSYQRRENRLLHDLIKNLAEESSEKDMVLNTIKSKIKLPKPKYKVGDNIFVIDQFFRNNGMIVGIRYNWKCDCYEYQFVFGGRTKWYKEAVINSISK